MHAPVAMDGQTLRKTRLCCWQLRMKRQRHATLALQLHFGRPTCRPGAAHAQRAPSSSGSHSLTSVVVACISGAQMPGTRRSTCYSSLIECCNSMARSWLESCLARPRCHSSRSVKYDQCLKKQYPLAPGRASWSATRPTCSVISAQLMTAPRPRRMPGTPHAQHARHRIPQPLSSPFIRRLRRAHTMRLRLLRAVLCIVRHVALDLLRLH